MHPLLDKILILIPILALLGILVYSKINESFDSSNPAFDVMRDRITNLPSTTVRTIPETTIPSTTPAQTISTQLTSQIAGKLGISLRRIESLDFNGDLNKRTLAVSFTILDANIIETSKGEPNAPTAAANANNLFASNQFTVEINGNTILLTKMNSETGAQGSLGATKSASDFFNNKGLLDSAAYARKVYNAVPVDESATRFFTLKPDSNFNLVPVLE